MGIKKGQVLELDITDIAFGGKGFAKVDGFAVFVDKAVAGDRVSVRITRKKKNYAEARVLELLEPSSFRVDAVCEYSGYCGGCNGSSWIMKNSWSTKQNRWLNPSSISGW